MTTLLVTVAQYDADTQTGSYHGLWQRISITIGFGYFSVLAAHLLRRHGERPAGQRPTSASWTHAVRRRWTPFPEKRPSRTGDGGAAGRPGAGG
jgi:hypothetical protein